MSDRRRRIIRVIAWEHLPDGTRVIAEICEVHQRPRKRYNARRLKAAMRQWHSGATFQVQRFTTAQRSLRT